MKALIPLVVMGAFSTSSALANDGCGCGADFSEALVDKHTIVSGSKYTKALSDYYCKVQKEKSKGGLSQEGEGVVPLDGLLIPFKSALKFGKVKERLEQECAQLDESVTLEQSYRQVIRRANRAALNALSKCREQCFDTQALGLQCKTDKDAATGLVKFSVAFIPTAGGPAAKVRDFSVLGGTIQGSGLEKDDPISEGGHAITIDPSSEFDGSPRPISIVLNTDKHGACQDIVQGESEKRRLYLDAAFVGVEKGTQGQKIFWTEWAVKVGADGDWHTEGVNQALPLSSNALRAQNESLQNRFIVELSEASELLEVFFRTGLKSCPPSKNSPAGGGCDCGQSRTISRKLNLHDLDAVTSFTLQPTQADCADDYGTVKFEMYPTIGEPF